MPDKPVVSADLALLQEEGLPPAVEVELYPAEVRTACRQPSQRSHPRPVAPLVAVALSPAHLRHGLIPWDHVPSVIVIDVYPLAAGRQQALCRPQVVGPHSLEEAPLRGDAGRCVRNGVVKAKRDAQVEQRWVPATEDEPHELSQGVGRAPGACEPVHVLHNGCVLSFVVLLLLLLCILLPSFVHLRRIVPEVVNNRLAL
mmetsp:Transcript_81584/g.225961  ORF Transcript_81584/g.225961 Transcript_81584/m.225961 type:complete len:200 (+) Transcript_81584:693-1292(+)